MNQSAEVTQITKDYLHYNNPSTSNRVFHNQNDQSINQLSQKINDSSTHEELKQKVDACLSPMENHLNQSAITKQYKSKSSLSSPKELKNNDSIVNGSLLKDYFKNDKDGSLMMILNDFSRDQSIQLKQPQLNKYNSKDSTSKTYKIGDLKTQINNDSFNHKQKLSKPNDNLISNLNFNKMSS